MLGYRASREVRLVVPVGRSVIIAGEGEPRISGGRSYMCDPASLKPLEEVRDSAGRSKNVVLVGPTDSGKSTLASYLYNSGLTAALASFDVGQNELYCPGFSATASPPRPFVPGSPAGEALGCLVGDFTPRGLEASYLYCASRLLRARGPLVVDTDGWVEGEGLVLKAAMASFIDAVVVAIGLEGRRRELLSYVGDVLFVPRLAPRSKSRSERATNRDRLMASCLSGARRRVLPADVALGPTQEGRLEGLLSSVLGGGQEHFAVVERASERTGTVTVLTRYDGDVDGLRLGRARIDLRSFSGLVPS